MMIKFVNRITNTEMWVADERGRGKRGTAEKGGNKEKDKHKEVRW